MNSRTDTAATAPAFEGYIDPGAARPLFPNRFSFQHQAARAFWRVVYLVFFRPSPVVLHFWRRFLLRAFGARIGAGVAVYPSARIWAPWNLRMDDHACMGPYVDCYTCDVIEIGSYAVVSQYSFLCTGTHDYTSLSLPLVTKPITIGDRAWICSDCFVAPGVTIGVGAVVGARSSVFGDIPAWVVAYGNPAHAVKRRLVSDSDNVRAESEYD